MEHKTLEAKATTTDQGEFTAIAAAYTVDRVKDQIMPGAFADTIDRWQKSGKLMPLHWNHQGEASNIIGAISPQTMRETDDGLYVEGRVDVNTSDTAREAWRSMKNNTMSLSFGYLVNDSKRSNGVNQLKSVDLFEVSIVPAPANADTRILSTKNLENPETVKAVDELNRMLAAVPETSLARVVKDLTAETNRIISQADVTDKQPETVGSVDTLRQRSYAGTAEWDDLRRDSHTLMLEILSQ